MKETEINIGKTTPFKGFCLVCAVYPAALYSLPRDTAPGTCRVSERDREMKPMPVEYLAELEEQSSTMAMDVDDVEALDIFGDGPIAVEHHRIADADFFNSFQDDFDDSDIN